MRKKFYTLKYVLLSVLFAFFLSPVMAEEYPLEILGQKVTDANKDDLTQIAGVTPGAEVIFRYDAEAKTLVMKNVTANVVGQHVIKNTGIEGFRIHLTGKNRLKTTKTVCSLGASSLIEGEGELSISTTSGAGILLLNSSTLTISDITLTVEGKRWGISGDKRENLVLNNVRLKAKGSVAAIDDLAALTLKDSKIILPHNGFFHPQMHTVVDQNSMKTSNVNIEAVYDLYVLGEQVTKANCEDLSAINTTKIKLGTGGKFAYDHKKKTLTMQEVTIEENDVDAIQNTRIKDLRILVAGKNRLKTDKAGLYLTTSTLLEGAGELSISTPQGTSISIRGEHSLTISNLTLNIEGKWGIAEENGNLAKSLTLQNTIVTVKSTECAVSDFTLFSTKKCAIIQPQNGRWDERKHAIVDHNENKAQKVKIAPINVERIELEPEILERKVGESWTFTPKLFPTNATNTELSWSSSKQEVATVINGVLQAVGRGKATITVTTQDGGHMAQCEVTVIETFRITTKIMGEGTLSFTDASEQPLTLSEIPYGTVVKVGARPEEKKGYVLKELKANGVPVQNSLFTMTADTEIEALFALKTFVITEKITGEGTLIFTDASEQPLTLTAVPYGTVVKVIARPEEKKGYVLKELKANGVPVQNNSFTMTADTELTAHFEKQTFAVVASVKENKGGSIEVTGAANLKTVEYGTELSVKTMPDKEKGYKLKEILVNDKLLVGETFTVKEITKVEAIFEKQTFVVTAKVQEGVGGLVALSGAENFAAVEFGTELTVVTMPAEGYVLAEIQVNGTPLPKGTMTFTVTRLTTVTALFKKKEGKSAEPQTVEDSLLTNITVAPNPFTSLLRIVNPNGVALRYELVDLMGTILRSGVSDSIELFIATSELPSGVYFVRLAAQTGIQKTVRVSK